jgi:hypothetical protein
MAVSYARRVLLFRILANHSTSGGQALKLGARQETIFWADFGRQRGVTHILDFTLDKPDFIKNSG